MQAWRPASSQPASTCRGIPEGTSTNSRGQTEDLLSPRLADNRDRAVTRRLLESGDPRFGKHLRPRDGEQPSSQVPRDLLWKRVQRLRLRSGPCSQRPHCRSGQACSAPRNLDFGRALPIP